MTDLLTASYSAFRPGAGQVVRTSLGTPKWLLPEAATWPALTEAMPRGAYFSAPGPAFEDAFVDQLEFYGPRRIARRLAEITRQTGAQTLLICCFEPLPANCHRGLFSAWWLLRTGEAIAEFDPATSGQAARR
jgi:hypothetical protein